MKICKGDMIIECSVEEFVKIKDDLLDIEEEKAFEGKNPLFDNLDSIIDKWYSNLYSSPNTIKKGENKK